MTAEHENKQKGNKFSIYIELQDFESDFSDKKSRKNEESMTMETQQSVVFKTNLSE